MIEKAMDEAGHDVYDDCRENSPVGLDAGMFYAERRESEIATVNRNPPLTERPSPGSAKWSSVVSETIASILTSL
jgi:hypothetical protein